MNNIAEVDSGIDGLGNDEDDVEKTIDIGNEIKNN